jgi:hypothetical protein
MLSPYEGERIFEAEMVRLHQCDRTLYACTSENAVHAAAPFSFRQWLAERFLPARPSPAVLPAAPSPHLHNHPE